VRRVRTFHAAEVRVNVSLKTFRSDDRSMDGMTCSFQGAAAAAKRAKR
jgi:hypothetical protein